MVTRGISHTSLGKLHRILEQSMQNFSIPSHCQDVNGLDLIVAGINKNLKILVIKQKLNLQMNFSNKIYCFTSTKCMLISCTSWCVRERESTLHMYNHYISFLVLETYTCLFDIAAKLSKHDNFSFMKVPGADIWPRHDQQKL